MSVEVSKFNVCGDINFKLDTDASGYLLPYRYFKCLYPSASIKSLHKSVDMNVILHAYYKSTFKQLGSCCFNVHFNGATEQCSFFIVEGSFKALLGLPDLLCLCLINIHDFVLNSTSSIGKIDLVHPKQKTSKKGTVLSKDSVTNHRFKFVLQGLESYMLNQQKSN